MRNALSDVGVADREKIGVAAAEIRPERSHEVCRIRTAEASMHSLSLLQCVIQNCHRAHQWIAAPCSEGAEVYDDRRYGSYGRSLELNRAQRQGTRNGSERIVHE